MSPKMGVLQFVEILVILSLSHERRPRENFCFGLVESEAKAGHQPHLGWRLTEISSTHPHPQSWTSYYTKRSYSLIGA